MNDKDELIASFRQQLREALRKCSAQEQEIALLNHEIELLKQKSCEEIRETFFISYLFYTNFLCPFAL